MMIKDRNIEFELSKLQKQIDRKKSTTVTTKVTNVTNTLASETVLGKPIADDMSVSEGQVLAYNKSKNRWEPKTLI